MSVSASPRCGVFRYGLYHVTEPLIFLLYLRWQVDSIYNIPTSAVAQHTANIAC